jgi:iron complex outermembrane receptor protein
VAEKNKSYEFGLEAGMFQNKLHFNLTYYINTSNNMINSVPIAPSTGATNLNINSGSLQNKGIELQLTGDVIRTKDFDWQMTLNGTHISRKVLSLADGLTSRVLGNPFSTTFKAIPGESPYDLYMLPLARDSKSGEVIVDANGNPTFSSTMVNVGSPLPKIYGGYINSIRYKRLTLTALLEYRFGGKVVSYDNEFWTATGLSTSSLYGRDASNGGIAYYVSGGKNIPVSAGTPPAGAMVYNDGIIFKGVNSLGTANTVIIPASTYYQNRYYNFGTEDAVYKNNYIRLREVSLSYSLPASIIHKLKLQSLSVSFIARNLWFLYKTVPNESPDATLGTSTTNAAVMYSAYPPTRDFGAALKVNF